MPRPLVVLVTGTSTGIGRATAVHFARLGYRVYAALRDPGTPEGRAATTEDIRPASDVEGLPIRPVTLDVDHDASVARGVGEVLAEAGAIDVLVNNAGIGGGGPVEDVHVDWVKTLFETNYFGAVRMIRAVLPEMRERRGGVIVNVSSVFGRLALGGHGHYAAAKWALEAISEALAQEVQRFGIRVAIVEPGVVLTPIFAKARRFADPASPYFDHVKRLLLIYQKLLPEAVEPSAVAEVIHEAVTAPEPRLRYTVGDDARLFIEARRQMSDEDYVALGAAATDEEFLALVQRRFGFRWK